MNTPLVSVIVPIYKVEKYLRQCLDSLINQTLKDIEIICVDDGSPDKCIEIIQEYQKKDLRIRLIQQKNQGLSVARNTGIKKVKSPYVMFCDSDDWYDKTMCEKMYHAIHDHESDIACCGTNIVYQADEDKKEIDEKYYDLKLNGLHSVSNTIFFITDVSAWNKIFKVSIIKKNHIFFPKGLLYEDGPFFLKYLSVAKNIFYLNEKLYNYVRHEGSIMNNTFKKNPRAIDHVRGTLDIYSFLRKNNLLKKWKRCCLVNVLTSFDFSRRNIPNDQKHILYKETWKIIKKFSLNDIQILPHRGQMKWRQILQICYNHQPFYKRWW